MKEQRQTHPARDELAAFVEGTLDDAARQPIENHISNCDQCCDVLRSLPHDALVGRLRSAEMAAEPSPIDAPQPATTAASQRRIIALAVTVVALVGIALAAGPLWHAIFGGSVGTENDRTDVEPPSAPDGATEWIDLVPQVDVQRGAVAGNWRRSQGELHVAAAESARLVLPNSPPAEYDFEVQFTRHTGEHSIALIFVAGPGQATFEIDAWGQDLAGIQNIAGQSLQTLPGERTVQSLTNGRRYTALVQVRRDRVEAFLDGRRLAVYQGDGSDLNVLELWQIPDSRALGIGAYNSATTFHQVRIRPHPTDSQ